MASDTKHQKDGSFCGALGHFVLSWNQLEFTTHELLRSLLKSDVALVLTARLNSSSLEEALRVLVRSSLAEPLQEAICHTSDVFRRLRQYRNHYIHGLLSIYEAPSVSEGYIIAISKRGDLKEVIDRAATTELLEMADRCTQLGALMHDLLWLNEGLPRPKEDALSRRLELPPQLKAGSTALRFRDKRSPASEPSV
jgi:hypothetical protein